MRALEQAVAAARAAGTRFERVDTARLAMHCARAGSGPALVPVAWADRLGEYFGDYSIDFVDAGHFVQVQLPDRAAQEVRDFFTGRT